MATIVGKDTILIRIDLRRINSFIGRDFVIELVLCKFPKKPSYNKGTVCSYGHDRNFY
jgi:hypothetical protein